MPSQWEVTLTGSAGAGIPLAAPHAMVSGWLDDRAQYPGGRYDHGSQAKKWALGPLRAAAGDNQAVTLQIRLLDDALTGRLLASTQAGAPVRLGTGQYQVAGSARLLDQADWPTLRAHPDARAWQVRFLTPACTRRRNRAAPLLTPDALALGLAERWRLLDPATAPALPWRPGGCPVWVSDLDGRTEVQLLPRTVRGPGGRERREEVVSGFTGRVRYVCDDGPVAGAGAFGALLAFATFAGAGSHTAYGFGVTALDPTWQPPTRHSEVTREIETRR